MSIFSDLYISTHPHATHYDTRNPFSAEERIRHSHITVVELSLLWTLVDRREWTAELIGHFSCVQRDSKGTCLIHEFPAAFVRALAEVKPDRAMALAREWGAAPEVSTPTTTILPLIQNLIGLATRAQATGRQVFVWNRGPEPTVAISGTR